MFFVQCSQPHTHLPPHTVTFSSNLSLSLTTSSPCLSDFSQFHSSFGTYLFPLSLFCWRFDLYATLFFLLHLFIPLFICFFLLYVYQFTPNQSSVCSNSPHHQHTADNLVDLRQFPHYDGKCRASPLPLPNNAERHIPLHERFGNEI